MSLKACAWRRAHSKVGIHLKWRSSFKHLCVCWFIYLFIQLPLSLPVVHCDSTMDFSEIVLFSSSFGIKVLHVPKIRECTLQAKSLTRFGTVARTHSRLFVPSCSCLVFSWPLTSMSRFELFKTLLFTSSLKLGGTLAHLLLSFVIQTEQERQHRIEHFIVHEQKANQN